MRALIVLAALATGCQDGDSKCSGVTYDPCSGTDPFECQSGICHRFDDGIQVCTHGCSLFGRSCEGEGLCVGTGMSGLCQPPETNRCTREVATTDAPAGPAIVLVDPCPGGEAVTITTVGTTFSPPSATIDQGQVVKLVSTATHPIGSIAPTDAILNVPENQTKCFRFTRPGTFPFSCTVHGNSGALTVR